VFDLVSTVALPLKALRVAVGGVQLGARLGSAAMRTWSEGRHLLRAERTIARAGELEARAMKAENAVSRLGSAASKEAKASRAASEVIESTGKNVDDYMALARERMNETRARYGFTKASDNVFLMAHEGKDVKALTVYDKTIALSQMEAIEIRFPARGLNAEQRMAFTCELVVQEAELNRLSLTDTANLEANLAKFHGAIPEESNFYRMATNNARRMARERLRGTGAGDAAHNLDAVAGGYLHNITELRNPIQQRVGSLWKHRWQEIQPGRKHRLIPEFE
jgi:hypothetical protein